MTPETTGHTAMASSEPNFKSVGLARISVGLAEFLLVLHLFLFFPLSTVLRLVDPFLEYFRHAYFSGDPGLGHLSALDTKLGLFLRGSVVEISFELSSAFIERDSMSEITNGAVGRDKW